MDLTGDELAGVVDLFAALTRPELGRALAELAYKRGEDREPDAFDPLIDEAVASYHLVAFAPDAEHDDGGAVDGGAGIDGASGAGSTVPWLLAGPIAFPELPEGGEDLPHILEIETRSVDRAALGAAVRDRLRRDAAEAIVADDEERMAQLVDVSYELEAWAPVDATATRERLDRELG
ncbi:MAG: hypothetical protein ABEJ31_09975 [Haloarculaceae archaeon]